MAAVAGVPIETRIVLKEWLVAQKHTDVTFILTDRRNRNVEVKCHKIMLASRSRILECMLFHSNTRIFRALNDSYEEFMNFINYLYTDVMNYDTVTSIFRCAIKYKVDLNRTDFKTVVCIHNILSLFVLATSMADESRSVYLEIIQEKMLSSASLVIKSTSLEFLNLTAAQLVQLLQIRGLNILIDDLFQAVNAWAEFQCGRMGLRVTSVNKRRVLGVGLETLPSIQTAVRAMSVTNFQSFLDSEIYLDFISQENMLNMTLDAGAGNGASNSVPAGAPAAPVVAVAGGLTIRLIIQSMWSTVGFFLDVDPMETIEYLKREIFRITQIPLEEQILILRGRLLNDTTSTIGSLGIQAGEMLHFGGTRNMHNSSMPRVPA